MITRTPIRVTFFDGAHYSLVNAGLGVGEDTPLQDRLNSILPDSGNVDVTEFVQRVSWSFSTNSPYEQIKISMDMPAKEVLTTLPNSKGRITTGFWVTIHSNEDKHDKSEFGKLLCWGRVSTLNLSRRADSRTGAVTARVSLTTDSWVHFLDQNMQIFTETGKRASVRAQYPNNKNLSRSVKVIRDAALKKWRDVTITGSEVVHFYEGFIRATLGSGNFFGEDRLHIGLSMGTGSYGDTLKDSSLGKSAANVYHKFAKNTLLPPSLQRALGGKVMEKNKINFSNLIAFIYDGKSFLHDDMFANTHAATDLSRFGYHDSVPMGLSSKLIIDQNRGFGIWSTLRSMYLLDPNLVEMFPTLLEVAIDEHEMYPGINTDGSGRRSEKDYVFFTSSPLLPGDPSFEEVAAEGIKGYEDVPFIFGVYEADTPTREPIGSDLMFEMGAEQPPLSGRLRKRMIPVIMYRLKPVGSPSNYSTPFLTNHQNILAKAQNPNMPNLYPPAGAGRAFQTHTAAGRYPHFTVDSRVYQGFRGTIYKISASEIIEFSANLSENKRVVATSVRTNFAGKLQAGLGFSSVRELIIDAEGFLDYGFRYHEFNFGLDVGTRLVRGNQNIIRALNEYGNYLLKKEAQGLRGVLVAHIRPEIRAGMWVEISFEEENTRAAIYVEEVTHSTDVAPNGSIRSSSQIKFSMMDYFPELADFYLGETEISG